MNWGYYTDLRPDELAAIREETSVAYLPWGALEWHGPHLPAGVDGFVAQEVAEQVVRRTGGVLLPTVWWSATPLPHPESLTIHIGTIHDLWNDIFAALARTEWRVVVVISGHYAQGHELVLMNAAEHAIEHHNLLVLALTPMALIDEAILDHAGLWQSSLMMALRNDLVNLEALGKDRLIPAQSGVIGQDPRGTASASIGKHAINLAVDLITRSVQRLLVEDTPATLYALYENRRIHLRAFVEQYDQGSLEEATRAWWEDVCRQQEQKQAEEEQKKQQSLKERQAANTKG